MATKRVGTTKDRWATTHQALQDAAIARFRRQGFDETSVAEIASDVGVSERTFYRHFVTKEAVLFGDQEERLTWLEHALELRSDDEPIYEAVMAAMLSFPGDVRLVREAAQLRHSLIRQDQALDALSHIQADFATAISGFAARRLADHPDGEMLARVTGAAIAAVLLSVFDFWGQHGALDDIGELDRKAFDFLRAGLRVGSEE